MSQGPERLAAEFLRSQPVFRSSDIAVRTVRGLLHFLGTRGLLSVDAPPGPWRVERDQNADVVTPPVYRVHWSSRVKFETTSIHEAAAVRDALNRLAAAAGVSLPDSGDAPPKPPTAYDEPPFEWHYSGADIEVRFAPDGSVSAFAENAGEGSAPPSEPESIEAIRSDEAVRDAFVECYTLQGIVAVNGMNVTPEQIADWDRVESALIRAILARAGVGSAPPSAPDGLRDRDELWCKALISTLDSEEVETTLRWFNEHRPDGAARAALGSAPQNVVTVQSTGRVEQITAMIAHLRANVGFGVKDDDEVWARYIVAGLGSAPREPDDALTYWRGERDNWRTLANITLAEKRALRDELLLRARNNERLRQALRRIADASAALLKASDAQEGEPLIPVWANLLDATTAARDALGPQVVGSAPRGTPEDK
jgi:hypothetical protein